MRRSHDALRKCAESRGIREAEKGSLIHPPRLSGVKSIPVSRYGPPLPGSPTSQNCRETSGKAAAPHPQPAAT